jgi:hypothetical protein
MTATESDSVLTDDQWFAILMIVLSVLLFMLIRRDETDT